MKIAELRAQRPEELTKQLDSSELELLNLRFRLTTRQLVNHREIKRVQKNIAQLKTVLKEKELGIR